MAATNDTKIVFIKSYSFIEENTLSGEPTMSLFGFIAVDFKLQNRNFISLN